MQVWHICFCVLLIAGGGWASLEQLDWLVGRWRAEYSGKVFWPTVPTMTFGEELIIRPAPLAKSSAIQFLNFRLVSQTYKPFITLSKYYDIVKY